jgi:hypothetical protein
MGFMGKAHGGGEGVASAREHWWIIYEGLLSQDGFAAPSLGESGAG